MVRCVFVAVSAEQGTHHAAVPRALLLLQACNNAVSEKDHGHRCVM